jgi:COX assembly mitochondrial protein 1
MSEGAIRTNPSWLLAPYEEKEVRKRCQDQANKQCARAFFEFGQCSEKHQFLFSWKCKEQKQAVIDCVAYWGSQEVFEKVRDDYIAEKNLQLKVEKEEFWKKKT